MSMKNSRKLMIVYMSITAIFGTAIIFITVFSPENWTWIVASLIIGLLIAGAPLLRAYMKAKKQEEQEELMDQSLPAKGVTCDQCGYELQFKETYCNNCGYKVTK